MTFKFIHLKFYLEAYSYMDNINAPFEYSPVEHIIKYDFCGGHQDNSSICDKLLEFKRQDDLYEGDYSVR